MNLITLDFESYYDGKKRLGFKTQTTEEYVRDSRFEVIGVGVKVNDGPETWFSGSAKEISDHLNTYDWAGSALLCHNTLFDGCILSWRFGIKPAYLLDTLSMARAIHGVEAGGSLAKLAERYSLGKKGDEVVAAEGKRLKDFTPPELAQYGEYCKNDVDLTFRLFQELSNAFPQDEFDLIDMTLKMFTEPVFEVDDALLIDRLEEIQQEKQNVLRGLMGQMKLDTEEAVRKKLASGKQFAAILLENGVEPPMKVSKITGKDTYALAKNDEGFLALTEHKDPFIQQLCSVRLGTKSTIEESRIQRFIDIGKRNKGRLPIPLKYYGAHTGRWAGCLVADTEVLVYNDHNGVEHKRIVDVLLDDLVWDGEAFVPHEGVVFSGFSEVINHDGIEGTEDHVVFTDAGEISLRDAMQGDHTITTARSPTQNDVEAARQHIRNYKI